MVGIPVVMMVRMLRVIVVMMTTATCNMNMRPICMSDRFPNSRSPVRMRSAERLAGQHYKDQQE